MASTWDDQRQQKLVQLAAQKLTATQIGAKLGVTRNAVIGRAARTGVRLCSDTRAIAVENGRKLVQWDQDPKNRSMRIKRMIEAKRVILSSY